MVIRVQSGKWRKDLDVMVSPSYSHQPHPPSRRLLLTHRMLLITGVPFAETPGGESPLCLVASASAKDLKSRSRAAAAGKSKGRSFRLGLLPQGTFLRNFGNNQDIMMSHCWIDKPVE
jgi:hypothetical protein